jgi:ectoine hydroxylase-related dioxygenase (phytanoyl-CoA dioxygenase family)
VIPSIEKTSPEAINVSANADFISRKVAEFQERGYVVWPRLFDAAFIEALRRAYSVALQRKVDNFCLRAVRLKEKASNSDVLNDFNPKGGNHDVNRWNMHLPSRHPLFDERLFADPTILSVVESLMGADCVCYLIASDTPFPGATTQRAHQDFSRFSIAVNIPLVDCTEENGPLELWPRSHRPLTGSGFSESKYLISAEGIRGILTSVPSEFCLLDQGSVIIRDHRLVHRGTANVSDAPRPMLSIYYVRPAPIPYRFVADFGARVALFLRRWGRGKGDQIQRLKTFSLGNILGRIVEEYSLSDRDYRRPIPTSVWAGLSPRARKLLRYASVDSSAGLRQPRGSMQGTWRFLEGWTKSAYGFSVATITGKPRNPDEEDH